MHDILDDFCNPVCCKCDKGNQTNDFSLGAAALSCACLIPRVVFCINGYQSDTEPCAESGCDESSDEGDNEDMAVIFGDIDYDFQHENREGNSGDPGNEADDVEDGEDDVDNSCRVISSRKVDDGGTDTEDDLQNSGDPNCSAEC